MNLDVEMSPEERRRQRSRVAGAAWRERNRERERTRDRLRRVFAADTLQKARKRYHQSDKGKAFRAKHRASEKRKAWLLEYRQKPEVKARINELARAAQGTPDQRAKAAARAKQRIASNITARLSQRVSARMRAMLKKGKGGASWQALVGYTADDLKRHLERQFQNSMSWETFGQWHVDHIVPLASFSYTSAEDPDFHAAWAITNLRPLWKRDNLAKGRRRTVLL